MQHWVIISKATGAVLLRDITDGPEIHPSTTGTPFDPETMDCHLSENAGRDDIERFDIAEGKWVPDIAKLRPMLRAAIEQKKFEVQAAGCMTPKGRVQTDPSSREKVVGAVQMAVIAQFTGAPFSQDWTMENEEDLAHDAAEMIALGLAVGNHVAAAHAHARALKLTVEAAETAEDLVTIDIAAGWPE